MSSLLPHDLQHDIKQSSSLWYHTASDSDRKRKSQLLNAMSCTCCFLSACLLSVAHHACTEGVTPAQNEEAKQLLTWLKHDQAIDEVSRSLDIATPLLEVLSALLGMLKVERLEDMLEEEVEEHDSAIQHWAGGRFAGGGAGLEIAENLKQLAQDKVDILQRCKELQEPCGSAVSALCNALAQMQAMQAEVPLNGKKRKRGSDQAK